MNVDMKDIYSIPGRWIGFIALAYRDAQPLAPDDAAKGRSPDRRIDAVILRRPRGFES
jgi:hypothetical protein